MITSSTGFVSLVVFFFAGRGLTLSSLSGSPCYDTCQGSNTTVQSDLVCTDEDFETTPNGIVLEECISCLANSSYSVGPVSDSMLFLAYISMVQQKCLSGTPTTPISECESQCTEIAEPLPTGFSKELFQDPWGFCTEDNSVYLDTAPACSMCLQAQKNTVILGNFLYVGGKGCESLPDLSGGQPIYNASLLFNTTVKGSNGKTTKPTSTSSISSPSSTSIATNAAASSTSQPSSTASAGQTEEADRTNSQGLSSGAAAAVGIIMGLLGVAAIIALAVFARRRMQEKQRNGTGGGAGAGPWHRMPDDSKVRAEKSSAQSAIPPAAGVYIPPPIPESGLTKRTKSFKSIASKSLKSVRDLTPRTSEWYYAANPKKSGDLSALPQRGWD